jgi:hypothetical protein
MTWLALLWLGIGLADLVDEASGFRRRWIGTLVGGLAQVGLGLLALTVNGPNAIAIAVCVGVLALWRWSHRTPTTGRRAALGGLAIMLIASLVGLAFSGLCQPVSGPIATWLAATPRLAGAPADHVLPFVGGLLLNLSSGNTLVRDALVAAGVSPLTQGPGAGASLLAQPRLRGGRVLGPMERVLILGFGASGNLAAAGLVVAAKGLVRFPELSATSRDDRAPRIDEVTEYFLIGSFASILLALSCLAVVS